MSWLNALSVSCGGKLCADGFLAEMIRVVNSWDGSGGPGRTPFGKSTTKPSQITTIMLLTFFCSDKNMNTLDCELCLFNTTHWQSILNINVISCILQRKAHFSAIHTITTLVTFPNHQRHDPLPNGSRNAPRSPLHSCLWNTVTKNS